MRPRPRTDRLLGLAALLAIAGCEEPRHAKSSNASPIGQATATASTPAPAPTPGHGYIVGQRTQDIRDAEAEKAKGAGVASQKIVAKDPITLPGNAYVTIVGRNSMLNIQHAVDLYQAENGRYPKDYQEFMDEIIKKNSIALPTLPYYQEYGYDAPTHKLIILEYPDRKANPPRF